MHLRNALSSGTLRVPEAGVSSPLPGTRARLVTPCFRTVEGLPHGARVVLGRGSAGRCVFLEADRRCAVHRQLASESLPSACRDFPRVATLTPLGVSITLSHYCPTAAALLFVPVPVRVLDDPPGFPASWPYEGLDAREAPPPLLRPGVLMDWPSLERWERFAVSVLADAERSPESALDVLAGAAEEARRWTPHDGPFAAFFEHVLSSRGTPIGTGPEGSAGAGGSLARTPRPGALGMAWHLVADCVPHQAILPPPPEASDEADERWVRAHWPALAGPIRRWIAAKAFGSWLALQGEGLRTTVLGLRLALGVLRAEAARGCTDASRALDAELLKEAGRRADLLLVHLADPEALARRLSRCEPTGAPPTAW